jgi:hypothetical protein
MFLGTERRCDPPGGIELRLMTLAVFNTECVTLIIS